MRRTVPMFILTGVLVSPTALRRKLKAKSVKEKGMPAKITLV